VIETNSSAIEVPIMSDARPSPNNHWLHFHDSKADAFGNRDPGNPGTLPGTY